MNIYGFIGVVLYALSLLILSVYHIRILNRNRREMARMLDELGASSKPLEPFTFGGTLYMWDGKNWVPTPEGPREPDGTFKFESE